MLTPSATATRGARSRPSAEAAKKAPRYPPLRSRSAAVAANTSGL